MSDVAESAAFVLSFLEVPDVPAFTPAAFAGILAGVGVLAVLILALTSIVP